MSSAGYAAPRSVVCVAAPSPKFQVKEAGQHPQLDRLAEEGHRDDLFFGGVGVEVRVEVDQGAPVRRLDDEGRRWQWRVGERLAHHLARDDRLLHRRVVLAHSRPSSSRRRRTARSARAPTPSRSRSGPLPVGFTWVDVGPVGAELVVRHVGPDATRAGVTATGPSSSRCGTPAVASSIAKPGAAILMIARLKLADQPVGPTLADSEADRRGAGRHCLDQARRRYPAIALPSARRSPPILALDGPSRERRPPDTSNCRPRCDHRSAYASPSLAAGASQFLHSRIRHREPGTRVPGRQRLRDGSDISVDELPVGLLRIGRLTHRRRRRRHRARRRRSRVSDLRLRIVGAPRDEHTDEGQSGQRTSPHGQSSRKRTPAH